MVGSALNLPNAISLGRLLLVPLTIWLMLGGRYGVAFWVFVAAGASDALDGFIAKRFDMRTRLGAMLDPVADKALIVSVFLALGAAHELPAWLVILVVFRDAMLVGGYLLLLAIGVSRQVDPLYVSKLNTLVQITLVGFELARLGLGAEARMATSLLILLTAATTTLSGLSYLVRWARIVSRSEEAL
jgi:cardiolipin synthase (CMP-forming)